jgi:Poly(3-hydroxybutyrate) depolymerase
MMYLKSRNGILTCLIIVFAMHVIEPAHAAAQNKISLTIGNEVRDALVVSPENKNNTALPVVFVFHGHGGNMLSAERQFRCESYWPDAIFVYPQGLKTPGSIVDKKGMFSGWQENIGDNGDRDILFFDGLLGYLKEHYNIDEKRIYVIGHSNGGLFAYELWAARNNDIAAISAISAVMPSKTNRNSLRPIPVFHVAGTNDRLVKIAWQNKLIDFLRELNGCGAETILENNKMHVFNSPSGNDVVMYIHDGGHEIPDTVMPLIMNFLKEKYRR